MSNDKFFLYFFVPQMSPTYWIIILMVFCINLLMFMNLLNTLYLKLYANLIAGHLLMILLSNFMMNMMYMFPIMIFIQNLLFMLEIFMSFIQSYVFSMLSILYFSEAKK